MASDPGGIKPLPPTKNGLYFTCRIVTNCTLNIDSFHVLLLINDSKKGVYIELNLVMLLCYYNRDHSVIQCNLSYTIPR